MARVLILHPGSMGAVVGACLVAGGHEVSWLATGRSGTTRARADAAGFLAHDTLDGAVRAADVVLSICPPDNAIEVSAAVADAVIDTAADITYVDANAVAPITMTAIVGELARAQAPVVDGGIVGPPPNSPDTTRLYLSGSDAGEIAALFHRSNLVAIDMGGVVGAASALKLSYAAWTKGSAAMLLTIAAAAEAHGVADHLRAEWDLSQPGVTNRLALTGPGVAPKAWRWEGEMQEIAATMAQFGLPAGFHLAASETWRRLAGFKDTANVDTAAVLARLLDG